MTKRNYAFDNLKGILIYLVVLGHLTFSFSHANTEFGLKLTSFIYFFHMPLFLIISGYFSKKKIAKETMIQLLLLFLFMNVSYTIYDYLVTGRFQLFIFKYSSWYILLLLLYRLVLRNSRVLNLIKKRPAFILTTSLIVAVVTGFFKADLFILRIFENWVYFLVGFLLRDHSQLLKKKIPKCLTVILFVFCFSIVFLVSFVYSHNILYYLGETYTNYKDSIVKLIIIITNIGIFYTSVQLLPDRRLPLLTHMGKNSLYIYVFHRIPTLIITELIMLDRKLAYIVMAVAAFLLCLILCSKVVVWATDKILNFLVKGYSQKNKILIVSTGLLLLALLYFSFSVTHVSSFKNKKTIDPDTISIGFVGDLILLERQVQLSQSFIGYDFDYMFDDMKKYFRDTDYVIGVFEGPSDDSQAYSVGNYDDNKELRINHPAKFINSVRKSGIDLVTLANNHIYDRGYQGALKTQQNLEDRGMDYVGSGRSNPQRKIVEMYGLKVGFLAYTFYANYPNDSTDPDLVRFLCHPDSPNFNDAKEQVAGDFSYLKEENVDLIIVLPHYGNEFNFDFSSYQEKWNQVFVENGANIVFGDHSHVVGPIRYEGDTLLVSSPGNYVNSYYGQDSDLSQYITVHIDKKTKKIVRTTSVPMLAKREDKGYYPVSLYDLDKRKKDQERVKQVLSIFGKVVMNDEEIGLKKEYVIGKEYPEELPLSLTEKDKNSRSYQLIADSNRICFLGDSITEGTMNDYHPWYEALMENFDKEVVNISRGSFTSDDLLKEFHEDIKKSACDLAIINIGTNDIRYTMTDPKKYRKNIQKMIELLGENVDVILLSPWETYSKDKIIGDFVYKKKDLYGKYNQALIGLSSSSDHVYYINPIRYIKSQIYRNGEDTYLLDGVHPNKEEGISLYSYSIFRGEKY